MQFISKGGSSLPSGSWGSPAFSPLTPMNDSTRSYQGSMSLYRIGQSMPTPSFRLASKSRSLQRKQ